VVNFVFDPLHARFDFTLEGYAYEEGLNSHGDLPQCSPSDSVLERDLSGVRVFFYPPWELSEMMACHFERCKRTAPATTMAVFGRHRWAKFNTIITRHWKLYQEFHARTQYFLSNRLLARLNTMWVRLLHGLSSNMYNFSSWSTLIVNFTIQPRLHLLSYLPRYMYHLTSMQLPSLRYDNFLRTLLTY
jgi:hypothetical protein